MRYEREDSFLFRLPSRVKTNKTNGESRREGKMKNLIYILMAIGVIGWGIFKWSEKGKNERAERAKAYLAEQNRKAQQEKEDELRRKAVEAEGLAKDKAMGILRAYLDKEEKSLKDVIEESHINIALIEEDQLLLSSILRDLDAENERKAESARKRKKIRYDKAERVLSILNSEKMNQLAQKYIGEDFSAMRAEYKSRVDTIIKMHRETAKRLKASRDRFDKAVAGIDGEVDKKNAAAQTKISSANAALESRLNGLYKSLQGKKGKLIRLQKGLSSPQTRREVQALEKEVDELNREISKLEEIVALSRANLAHVDATSTETSARRKYDAAISTRQDDDNAVHSDMAHERTIFNTAMEYENRSLDRIRAEMKSRIDILNMRAFDAQKNLDYISDMTKSADFMSAKELEKLRSDIAKRLTEKVLKVAE